MGQASDSGVPSQWELIALILVASERGQEQAATEMTADISAGHSDTQIATGEDSFTRVPLAIHLHLQALFSVVHRH